MPLGLSCAVGHRMEVLLQSSTDALPDDTHDLDRSTRPRRPAHYIHGDLAMIIEEENKWKQMGWDGRSASSCCGAGLPWTDETTDRRWSYARPAGGSFSHSYRKTLGQGTGALSAASFGRRRRRQRRALSTS